MADLWYVYQPESGRKLNKSYTYDEAKRKAKSLNDKAFEHGNFSNTWDSISVNSYNIAFGNLGGRNKRPFGKMFQD